MRFSAALSDSDSNASDLDSPTLGIRPRKPVAPSKTALNRRGLVDLPSSDEETDSELSESDIDSEEELFPVAPPKPRSRIIAYTDAYEKWDQASRKNAWNRVHLGFPELQTLQTEAELKLRERWKKQQEEELDFMCKTLESMEVARKEEEERIQKDFDRRNDALWASINASIGEYQREAEAEAARTAAELRKLEEEAQKAQAEKAAAEKAKQEADLKLQQETQAAQEAEKSKPIEQAPSQPKTILPPKQLSPQVAAWMKWHQLIQKIKAEVLPNVSNNKAWKDVCYKAKRIITSRVGQLTNSRSDILEKTEQLHNVLDGLKSEPLCYTWGLNHFSKRLIKQAETEATAKQDVVYPLARVFFGLLAAGHTELADVFMARLVKKCFWVVGVRPPPSAAPNPADYTKLLGHSSPTETMEQYVERISGLIGLYAAIIQLPPSDAPLSPSPDKIPEHFRLAAGWSWLVCMLSPSLIEMQPTPELIYVFLKVAGERLSTVYGKQFHKFMQVLLQEGILQTKAAFMEKEKCKPAVARLQIMLEGWVKKGKVSGMEGRDPNP